VKDLEKSKKERQKQEKEELKKQKLEKLKQMGKEGASDPIEESGDKYDVTEIIQFKLSGQPIYA